MSTLQSRPARFDLNVPLSFKTEDGVEQGHCVNVSASGMLAVFEKAVDLFTTGEISMQIGDFFINITGRVARLQDADHGIAFLIENDSDRLTTQVLVDYAVGHNQPKSSGS